MKPLRLRALWVFVFITLLALVGLVFYAVRHLVPLSALVSVTQDNLLMWGYVLGGVIIFASLIVCVISAGQYHLFKRIRNKMSQLLLGQYEQMQAVSTLPEIDEAMIAVQQKMTTTEQRMQQDHQRVSDELTLAARERIVEQERHRIARELHDSVSQQLFAATMLLSAIGQSTSDTNDTLNKQMTVVEQVVNEAQTEMRALLLHLRPVKLEGKSLQQGITSLLKELDSKINLNLTSRIDDVAVSEEVEAHLFRIVQELVSNVLRHAKATALDVQLIQTAHEVMLRLTDNGAGFDVTTQPIGSYGLNNIRERVTSMGGQFKVNSRLQHGTVVEIRVPNETMNRTGGAK